MLSQVNEFLSNHHIHKKNLMSNKMRLEQAFEEVIYIVSLDIYFFRIFLGEGTGGEGGLLNSITFSNLYDNVSFSYFDLYGLSLYSWGGGGS